jgi:hypothetical protein
VFQKLRCAVANQALIVMARADIVRLFLVNWHKKIWITKVIPPGVQIFNIFPRFGRKSGGSKITVKGENFGLSGSQSVLRIAGKKSKACRYPFTEFVPNNAPTNADLLAAHCTNQVLDMDEDKTDCGGVDCPKCIANALPHHCSNGVLDFDETAVGTITTKLGLQDCGGKCLSAASCCNGKQDNDETGADCGGTHCQPCDRESYLPLSCRF